MRICIPRGRSLSCTYNLPPMYTGYFFFNLLVALHSMWVLSSLTRDQTDAICIGSRVLTSGPPGKSLLFFFLIEA